MKQLGPLGVFAIALVAACVVPLVGSDYAVSFSIQLLIFLVLAYSWNLIGGYTGYTHFGQVAFFGIGAEFDGGRLDVDQVECFAEIDGEGT